MTLLERLAKEKFGGDMRATWRYVLYEAPEEEMKRYISSATSEQISFGLDCFQRNPVNEIDELANSRFDGSLRKTWDYIFSSCSPEEVERYVDMADGHQAAVAQVSIKEGKHKYAKEARNLEKTNQKLTALQMSYEEVLAAEKNPYQAPVLKRLLIGVLGIGAIVALPVIGQAAGMGDGIFAAAISILGTANTCVAFSLAAALRDYFRFRSVKKALEKTEKYSVISV